MHIRSGLTLAAAGAVIAAVLVGCPHDEYVVVMRPRADQFERSVTMTHLDDSSRPTTMKDTKAVYRDQFPDDLGGNSGRIARYDSELGGASFYVERVRGRIDQATAVEAQFKAVDRLIDLLMGWTRQEYGKFAEYPKLAAFLDTDGRRLMKNFALFAWMDDAGRRLAPGADKDSVDAVVGLRFGEYVVEQGFLAHEDVPALMRAVQGDHQFIGVVVHKLLTRKIGLTDKAFIDALAKIADIQQVAGAFTAFAQKSPEFKKLHDEWQQRCAAVPANTTQPEPEPTVQTAVLEASIASLLNVIEMGTPDGFSIALHADRAPVFTNGVWDNAAGAVRWSFTFSQGKPGVPAMCTAIWAQPAEAVQKAHFGRVAVAGSDLLGYCIWRNALTGAEAEEWAAVWAKVQPGADLVAILKDKSFTGGQRMEGGQIILRALGLEKP